MKDCSVNSGYVHIDSPLIAANIAIRSKFWFNGPDPEERSLSTISYFASGRKRQLSFQFQLQFKQDHVEAHDLEWGIFVEKPVRLPPRWMVAMLVAAARMIDPLLEADISERGIRWFSPLLPFMNVVNVIEAKSPLSPLDWNLGGDLPELAESNALLFSDRKSRSEGDRKKVCKTASASSNVETISQTRIYNFEVSPEILDAVDKVEMILIPLSLSLS